MAVYQNQELTAQIIGAAIEVHRLLGPGLLESSYQACLARELSLQSIDFESEVPIPVIYKGISIDCSYRLDFLIANHVIVEIKSVERLLPIHDAQLMTYLKLCDRQLGLLINFNVPVLKTGLKRLIR